MANSTLSYFVLAGYGSMGRLRPLYCGLTLALYLWVLGLNGLLVLLICLERSLHRPMYLLLCGLFLNQLLGSSALLPFLARQVLAPVHAVPAHLCFLQVLCLYAYGNVEFCTLALICYDRHLAVCCPLQYSRRMSGGKALALLALTWLYGLLRPGVTVLLSARLPLCGNVLDGLYCQNYLISRLSCSGSGSRLSNIYGLLGLLPSVLLPLLAILVSYGKILRICFSASGRARRKALSTCAPHLASLLNFSFGCCFQIVQSRFLERRWPPPLRAFLELYFLLMQPLLSPVMYGLQLSGIRGAVGRRLRRLRREPCERLGAAQVRG